MSLPGKKAKIVTALDNAMSNFSTLYSIEIVLTKSPQKGVKCGAIVIFKMNDIPEIDFTKEEDPIRAFEAKKELNEMTQVMYRDPELFRESEGRWIEWVTGRAIEIFDELGTDADISIKSPLLRIHQKIKRSEIVKRRHDPSLFSLVKDIDSLLSKDFKYDPWSRSIRRGKVSADMAKR